MLELQAVLKGAQLPQWFAHAVLQKSMLILFFFFCDCYRQCINKNLFEKWLNHFVFFRIEPCHIEYNIKLRNFRSSLCHGLSCHAFNANTRSFERHMRLLWFSRSSPVSYNSPEEPHSLLSERQDFILSSI